MLFASYYLAVILEDQGVVEVSAHPRKRQARLYFHRHFKWSIGYVLPVSKLKDLLADVKGSGWSIRYKKA